METELLILDKLNTPVGVSGFCVFAFECYTSKWFHHIYNNERTWQIKNQDLFMLAFLFCTVAVVELTFDKEIDFSSLVSVRRILI